MIQKLNQKRAEDAGFTLIELLIAIVVIGVLSAVVIVGIGSLTNSGKASACSTSADAARAASVVHYANTNGTYPATITAMTAANELVLPTGSVISGSDLILTVKGWTMTMVPSATPPVFNCT